MSEAELQQIKQRLHACWLSNKDIYNITANGRMRLYTPRRIRAMIAEMEDRDLVWRVNLCGPAHSRAHEGVVAWCVAQSDRDHEYVAPEWLRGFVTCANEDALMQYVEDWIGTGVMLADGWYGINEIEWLD